MADGEATLQGSVGTECRKLRKERRKLAKRARKLRKERVFRRQNGGVSASSAPERWEQPGQAPEQATVRRANHRQTNKPQPATAGPQKSRLKSLLAGSHKHKPRGNYFPEFLFLRIIWPPAASTSMTESLCTVPSRTAFARRLTNSRCINLLIGRAP